MKVLLLFSVTLYTIWRVSAHDYNICAPGEIPCHQMCGGFQFFQLPPCGIGQICRLYPRSYYGRCCKRIIIAPKSPPRVNSCPSGSAPVEASCGGFQGASCPWGTFCVKPPRSSHGVCCKWCDSYVSTTTPMQKRPLSSRWSWPLTFDVKGARTCCKTSQ